MVTQRSLLTSSGFYMHVVNTHPALVRSPLLLGRDIMTSATLKRKTFNRGWLTVQKFGSLSWWEAWWHASRYGAGEAADSRKKETEPRALYMGS